MYDFTIYDFVLHTNRLQSYEKKMKYANLFALFH